ncbi:MAG: glycerol-3-phosphate dehydrogenase/oxidase [Anaerolineales bacterium]|jgi:glycerol-3-phosphate dehydrogenase
MWNTDWRDRVWDRLDEPWDIVVVGGGITGAGILREAVRSGLRTLLIDSGDFASGTSSRSSKLVHGGFRYLRDAKLRLTLVSVRERETLMQQGRGLVTPLGFLLANFKGDKIPAWVFGAGLIVYDLMGLQWGHQHYGPDDLQALCPPLAAENLTGGFRYFDAQTDDARLTLRVIREAVAEGGLALNYARAEGLLKPRSGPVCGVQVVDQAPGGERRSAEVRARIVINATGAWADDLRQEVGAVKRMRKLRGSHLVLDNQSLALNRAVTFLHPQDGRPVFALPWEGVTLFGTTDVDQDQPLEGEPRISPGEVDYLLTALREVFPASDLSERDVRATFAGVRGVIDTGKKDPSRESREHVLWHENGLVTVTGGKLTTFRVMAHDALRSIRHRLPEGTGLRGMDRILNPPPSERCMPTGLDGATCQRLLGRYGVETSAMLAHAKSDDFEKIGEGPYTWLELRYAAREEGIIRLDDLLLRRLRLGITLPNGALDQIDRIRSTAQPELGWDDTRWEAELSRYQRLWDSSYRLRDD